MAAVERVREGFGEREVAALVGGVSGLIEATVRREVADAERRFGGRPYALKVDGRARRSNLAEVRGVRRTVQVNWLDAELRIAVRLIERYIRSVIYRAVKRRTGDLGSALVVYYNRREYPSLDAVPDLNLGDRLSVWLTAPYAWVVNTRFKRKAGKGFIYRVARYLRGRTDLQGLYVRAMFRRNAAFVGGFQPGFFLQISQLLADGQRRNRTDRPVARR